jgi:FkbM family methyltransferase
MWGRPKLSELLRWYPSTLGINGRGILLTQLIMSKLIKQYGEGIKFAIAVTPEDRSGDEIRLLKTNALVDDYVMNGFDVGLNDTVIDIGAHIGRFSVYAGVRARQGSVYAYEPDPRNLAKLSENVSLNKLSNVAFFQKVVNATGKPSQFYFNSDSAENSLYAPPGTDGGELVSGTTLSAIFQDNGINRCNFLKLDCEGAEYEILFSAPASVFKKIDKIVLEYHDNLYKQKSLKDMVSLLSRQGFVVRKVKPGAWYLGLLYAKRSRLPRSMLLIINFVRVYCFDLSWFGFKLMLKKIGL